MKDPFRPTADLRPIPRPWGTTLLIVIVAVLFGLTVAYVADAIMTEIIAASIEAQDIARGQP